jgi:hypothetical protein
MAARDSSSRILMGNWSNHLPTMELYSNVANVNGNILATHMSTNTINCTSFDIYMPSPGAEGAYSNYTMPGTIADAYWSSNVLSGNLTSPAIHVLSNVTVGADWETWDPVYPVHVESQVNGISIFARYELAQVSDLRVKTNLEVIGDALEKVKRIHGYTFDRTDDAAVNVRQCGLVAQELQAVLPEAVHEHPSTGMLTVAYGNVVSILVNAIKELSDKVDALGPPPS